MVKVLEDDLALPTTLSASGLVGESVPLVVEGEEEKVELADALFGASRGGQPDQQKKKDKGSIGTL